MNIYELPFNQFSTAMPLFKHLWYDEVFIDAVMQQRQPGQVFVDHPITPTAALMTRRYDYFIVGDPQSPLRHFIKDAPTDIFQHFYGYAVGDEWKTALLQDNPTLEVIPRENYRWEGAAVLNWRENLPKGVEIKRFDRTLLEKAERESDFPFAHIFYDGYESFRVNGFGFCLLENNTTASFVYTCAMSDKEASIGVDTVPKFQKKGYATLVCSAFIEHCLQNNLLPTWDADELNTASIALAQKLGFVRHRPFYELAMPSRQPLPLSEDVWQPESLENGIIVWSK